MRPRTIEKVGWIALVAGALSGPVILVATTVLYRLVCDTGSYGWGRNRAALCAGEPTRAAFAAFPAVITVVMGAAIVVGIVCGVLGVSRVPSRRASFVWMLASTAVYAAAVIWDASHPRISDFPLLQWMPFAALESGVVLVAWLAVSGLVVLIVLGIRRAASGDR